MPRSCALRAPMTRTHPSRPPAVGSWIPLIALVVGPNLPAGDNEKTKSLAGLSRVVLISLSRDGDELSLVLRLRDQQARSEVSYEFLNVSDLRFRGERTELKELVLLLAEDVTSDGWEGVRFRVKDYEEEFISFLYREIRQG
jgi:hypothetical protein